MAVLLDSELEGAPGQGPTIPPRSQFVLLHPASELGVDVAEAMAASGVHSREVSFPSDLMAGEEATVLLLGAEQRDAFDPTSLWRFADSGGAVVLLGAPGEDDVPETFPDGLLDGFVPYPPGRRQLLLSIRSAYRVAAARQEALRARQEAAIRTREVAELTRIGSSLSTVRDTHKLLTLILSQALELTRADAGSLYLCEEGNRLRFKLAQNHSRPELEWSEFTVPIDRSSLAGYVASTCEPLVIHDAYSLHAEAEYKINRSFDEKHGYRTRSVLTLPMRNHQGEVTGVLQLINRKRRGDALLRQPQDFEQKVESFDRRSVEVCMSLASQAAIAIENSQLHASIERLFEGFVTAAVTAIEQRDPTTSGHSQRVADMTVSLAKTVDGITDGPFAAVRFSREELREVRYAGLLHDFGKVGVREEVLVKAKKLYPGELELIEQRFDFIRRSTESELFRRRMEYLEKNGRSGYPEALERIEQDYERQIGILDRFMGLVRDANEPTVLHEGCFEDLNLLAHSQYLDAAGQSRTFLSDHELRCLTIRKGSLDLAERREIESHVTHTFRFLSQIPWTKELSQVPHIAYGHHEKLNGRGYPRKISAAEIPVQTRMMTIADIYDALTAADRPYKRAVTRERALDIMRAEVQSDMLDPVLFQVFIEAGVYRGGSTES